MRRQILPALLMVVVFTVLLGGVYPLVVTGVSQVAFHDKANGSIVEFDGQVGRLGADRPGLHRPTLLLAAAVGRR